MSAKSMSIGVILVFAGLTNLLEAQVVLVPPGLSLGDPYHLVFVSSQTNTANFGGIAGADAFVQGLADAAGIGATQGITWEAILSDSTIDANFRFNPSVPIYDLRGNRVAIDGTAFWNAATVPLENPIAFDEFGSGSIFPEVWTGTDAGGFWSRSDSDWFSASPDDLATSGLAFQTNGQWIDMIDTAEDVPQSIFARSSQLIVTVPEPSNIFSWLLVGLIGVLHSRTRRESSINRAN